MRKDVRNALIILAVVLLLVVPSVSAAPNVTQALAKVGKQFIDLTKNTYVMYFVSFILVFMIMYAAFAAGLGRVPAFGGGGDQGLNKQGKTICIALAGLSSLGLIWRFGRSFDGITRFLSTAGWFAVIAFAALPFAIVYFHFKHGEGRDIVMALAAAGFGIFVYGTLMKDNNAIAWGMLLMIVFGIWALVRHIGGRDRGNTGNNNNNNNNNNNPPPPPVPNQDTDPTTPPTFIVTPGTPNYYPVTQQLSVPYHILNSDPGFRRMMRRIRPSRRHFIVHLSLLQTQAQFDALRAAYTPYSAAAVNQALPEQTGQYNVGPGDHNYITPATQPQYDIWRTSFILAFAVYRQGFPQKCVWAQVAWPGGPPVPGTPGPGPVPAITPAQQQQLNDDLQDLDHICQRIHSTLVHIEPLFAHLNPLPNLADKHAYALTQEPHITDAETEINTALTEAQPLIDRIINNPAFIALPPSTTAAPNARQYILDMTNFIITATNTAYTIIGTFRAFY